MGKTSDDYRPCVAIFPDGKTMKRNVLHIRMDNPDTAIDKLQHDHCAWVNPDDALLVLERWKIRTSVA